MKLADALFISAVLVFLWLIWVIRTFNNSSNSKKQKEIKVSLEDLSSIWGKSKQVVVRLEELSLLWRNMQIEENKTAEEIHFFNDTVMNFFKKHIEGKPFFTGAVRKVLTNLLTLLDAEGSVSSVVSGQNETESKIPKNTYEMLAQVSLVEHTINVAEEIIKLAPYGPILPQAIIAALGHDLGKIPKYRNRYYALGDHPFISVTVFESIQSFKELVYAEDILKAVRDHHIKPKEQLGEVLKEADQRARRRELSEVQKKVMLTADENTLKQSEPNIPEVSDMIDAESDDEPKQTNQTYQTPSPNTHFNQTLQPHQTSSNFFKQSKPNEDEEIPEIFSYQPAKAAKQNSHEASSEIFISVSDKSNTKEVETPKKLELYWFNVDEFLKKLEPYVNQLISGRWLACSFGSTVYVQPRLMWIVFKEMAQEKGMLEVLYAEADEEARRDYLYTVLSLIKQHKDAVETSLIKDEYFSAPFVVRMKNGETYRALYVPLKAQEAFSVSAGELEQRKEGKLLDIESITPPFDKTD